MDQTLIDFAASRREGLNAVLRTLEQRGHGVDRRQFLQRHDELATIEDDRYLSEGKWNPTQARFQTLCAEFGLPQDGFAKQVTDTYVEARYANLRQYPEAHDALEALRASFPLYLVTNGPADSQHREIRVTGMAPYFKRMFVCEDFGIRKPDRAVFAMIRQEAGVADHEMLMVGDNPEADIGTPRSMGWATVWVVRDDERRRLENSPRADAAVRSVAEVLPLLRAAR